MSQTHTTNDDAGFTTLDALIDDTPVLPLPLPPAELKVYLLSAIDTELLESEEELAKRYAGETDSQKQARMERYRFEWQVYRKQYDAYMQGWRARFRQYKQDMNAYLARLESAQKMAQIPESNA